MGPGQIIRRWPASPASPGQAAAAAAWPYDESPPAKRSYRHAARPPPQMRSRMITGIACSGLQLRWPSQNSHGLGQQYFKEGFDEDWSRHQKVPSTFMMFYRHDDYWPPQLTPPLPQMPGFVTTFRHRDFNIQISPDLPATAQMAATMSDNTQYRQDDISNTS